MDEASATTVYYYTSSTPVHESNAALQTTATSTTTVATQVLVGGAGGGGGGVGEQSTPPPYQPYRLKSHSYKVLNHTRLRSQSSPYHRQASIQTPCNCDFSSETDESSLNLNQHAHPTTPVSSSLLDDDSSSGAARDQPDSPMSSSPSLPPPSSSSSSSIPPQPPPLLKWPCSSSTSSTCNQALYPTPVSTTATTTSAVSSDQSSPQSSSASGAGVSSSAQCCSIQALTRSTSLGSLASDDMQSIKSTYSSHVNSTHGFTTPAYSELPDSPGECSYDSDTAAATAAVLAAAAAAQAKAQYYQQLHQHYLTYKNNMYLGIPHQMTSAYGPRVGYFGKEGGRTAAAMTFGGCALGTSHAHSQSQEETSVMTVDSNPKSNDITVVERTVLTTSTLPFVASSSSNEVTTTTAATSSSCERKRASTFQRAPATAHLQTSVGSASSVYYSATGSTSLFNANNSSVAISPWTANYAPHTNVKSQCSYAATAATAASDNVDSRASASVAAVLPTSTPTDLAFVRNLLSTRTKTTPISATKSTFEKYATSHYQENASKMSSWTSDTNFTPPVKLSNESGGRGASNNMINRALFTSVESTPNQQTDISESEVIMHYNDEEVEDPADDLRSILSLPSLIKADNEAVQHMPFNLDPLLTKAPSKINQALSTGEAIGLETTTDSDIGSPCFQHHHMVSLDTSENQSESADYADDEEDSDKIIDEFINENFKPTSEIDVATIDSSINNNNSGSSNKENNSESPNTSSDLESFEENVVVPELTSYVNPLKQEAGFVAARILPKIDEESEEERLNMSIVSCKKPPALSRRLSSSSVSSVRSTSAPLAKVVLTKTARLRMAQRLKDNVGNSDDLTCIRKSNELSFKKSNPSASTNIKPTLRFNNFQSYCHKTPAILNKFAPAPKPSNRNVSSVLTSINTNQLK